MKYLKEFLFGNENPVPFVAGLVSLILAVIGIVGAVKLIEMFFGDTTASVVRVVLCFVPLALWVLTYRTFAKRRQLNEVTDRLER